MIGDTRLPDRFWAKVVVGTGGCWLWQATCFNGSGYGGFWVSADKSMRCAHKVAFQALVAPVAPGLDLDHLCRVKQCCNPDHLEPVTRAENVRRDHVYRRPDFCWRGHPFSGYNLLIRPRQQACRECGRINKANYMRRQKAKK